MKTFALILIHFFSAIMLLAGSCSHKGNSKVRGDWHTRDKSTRLKITADKFAEDNGGAPPVAEDYFMKGDTIFTSYQGSQPYTKFVVQKVDDHTLTLLYPDSVSIEFVK